MTRLEYTLSLCAVLNKRRINFTAYSILAYAAQHQGRDLSILEMARSLNSTSNCIYGHIHKPLAGCFSVNTEEKALTYRLNRRGSELLCEIAYEAAAKPEASCQT